MPHTPDQPPRFPSDRSERAKAMVKAGLFGGAGRGQGRKPKNRTASEQVAELATQEARSIKRAFSDGLRSKNERTRLLAAKDLLAEERREIERRDYEAELRVMSHAELEAKLLEILSEELGLDLSELMDEDRVVDAEVVEDDQASDTKIESALAELGEKTENVSAPPPRQFGLRAWPRATAGDS
jgi:DNA primase